MIATRLMQTAEPETALEQSWSLAELHERLGFSLEELARRFGHSVSWVSRRLALVQELPDSIQQQVRRGEMGAHGAAKYLVPLARANRQACLELVQAIGSTRLSSRDLGILYTAYQTGHWVTRQRLLAAPLLFLKTHKETQAAPALPPGPGDSLLSDLESLSATARRRTGDCGRASCALFRKKIARTWPACSTKASASSHAWPNISTRRWEMLDQSTRAAILKLHEQGHSIRATARALKCSRGAVREVLRSATEIVPTLVREEKATPYRDQILDLYGRCNGNLVRVHEELVAAGAQLSYPALTAFCRRQRIGQQPPRPVGEYHFGPGQEMQHDTSPHRAEIGSQRRSVQTASLVCCYSRLLFFQFSPTFTRFDCKVFLTDALQYLQGACATCLIHNTHVVVLKGSGREMVPVPEMAAFAERYGFRFQAHEKGDANRSARVERAFRYIETNFLAGRTFPDCTEANRQARTWCDKVNARFRDDLKASPRELFAVEQAHLKPLPVWVPPVYLLHQRLVDVEGYVSVESNRYSVPDDLIGRQVEVRQTKEHLEIYRGPRRVATHPRVL